MGPQEAESGHSLVYCAHEAVGVMQLPSIEWRPTYRAICADCSVSGKMQSTRLSALISWEDEAGAID